MPRLVATVTLPLYVPIARPFGLTPIFVANGVVPVNALAVSHGTFNETEAVNGLLLLVT